MGEKGLLLHRDLSTQIAARITQSMPQGCDCAVSGTLGSCERRGGALSVQNLPPNVNRMGIHEAPRGISGKHWVRGGERCFGTGRANTGEPSAATALIAGGSRGGHGLTRCSRCSIAAAAGGAAVPLGLSKPNRAAIGNVSFYFRAEINGLSILNTRIGSN